jgi:Protein of unknown function (DUF3485)
MTTSRLVTLVAFMSLGFATVYLLPKNPDQPTGIRMELPDYVANWIGTDGEITDKERYGLGVASGTRIIRKVYRNLGDHEITVTIVLSGRDMSTSIHRPERCLDAQGWARRESDTFAVSLPMRGTFPVTQLRCSRLIQTEKSPVTLDLQAFYWFVGEDEICNGHWERWAIDNRDRLFRGLNQRWAFILVSGIVPPQRDPKDNEAARKGSQQAIRNFIAMLAPKIHLDTVQYH